MPTDIRPLFRPDALRPKLSAFALPLSASAARSKLGHWKDLLSSQAAARMKETELLGDFLRDVFGDLLGYVGPASGAPVYTIKRESLVEVDGKFADAALGRFSLAEGTSDYIVVIEGKGPRDPLDRPHAGRKRSAVEQALQYAVNLRIDWYLVTNMVEFRLFHKSQDLFTYERFETAKLAEDDAALKRFVYLLGAARVVPASGASHLDTLLADSSRIGREVTAEYYHEYATLRRHNPEGNHGYPDRISLKDAMGQGSFGAGHSIVSPKRDAARRAVSRTLLPGAEVWSSNRQGLRLVSDARSPGKSRQEKDISRWQ